MGWEELIGQSLAAEMLRRAVAAGRTAHAYLFTGPRGVGKQEAARLLARALNCLEPPVPGDSCGRCSQCRKVIEGVHPDVLVLNPPGRTIKLGLVVQRDDTPNGWTPVRTFVSRLPAEGRAQVVIVVEADRLGAEAANALLKTLEEPPPYTVFVLTTANEAGILPTIRSRCQPVIFPPAPLEVVAAALEREGMAPEQARLLAALSGGSIGRARELAGDEAVSRRREQARALLEEVARGLDFLGCLARAEALEQQRDEIPELLDLLLLWLRDCLLVAAGADPRLVVAQDALPFLQSLAASLGRERLLVMAEAVRQARQQIDRNAALRLVLDVMLLRLSGHSRWRPKVARL